MVGSLIVAHGAVGASQREVAEQGGGQAFCASAAATKLLPTPVGIQRGIAGVPAVTIIALRTLLVLFTERLDVRLPYG